MSPPVTMWRFYCASTILLATSIRSCSGAIIPVTDLESSSIASAPTTLLRTASPLPDYRTLLPPPGRLPHIPVQPEDEEEYYSRLSDGLSNHSSSESSPVQTITAAMLQPQNVGQVLPKPSFAGNEGRLNTSDTNPPPALAAASTIRPLPSLDVTSTTTDASFHEQQQQQQQNQQSRYPKNHFPFDGINATGIANTGIANTGIANTGIANTGIAINASHSSTHAAVAAGAITLQLANKTLLIIPYDAAFGDTLSNGSAFVLKVGEEEEEEEDQDPPGAEDGEDEHESEEVPSEEVEEEDEEGPFTASSHDGNSDASFAQDE